MEQKICLTLGAILLVCYVWHLSTPAEQSVVKRVQPESTYVSVAEYPTYYAPTCVRAPLPRPARTAPLAEKLAWCQVFICQRERYHQENPEASEGYGIGFDEVDIVSCIDHRFRT